MDKYAVASACIVVFAVMLFWVVVIWREYRDLRRAEKFLHDLKSGGWSGSGNFGASDSVSPK